MQGRPRATGRPISEVLRTEVAGPLGTADELSFAVPASEQSRLARLEEAEGNPEMFAAPVEAISRAHGKIWEIPCMESPPSYL